MNYLLDSWPLIFQIIVFEFQTDSYICVNNVILLTGPPRSNVNSGRGFSVLVTLATSQILMTHSAAQVMKMDGLKVFHSTLYTGAW